MGADCIISGIRPQIAQTMVHLGVELNVISKATLADAFAVALRQTGAPSSRSRGSRRATARPQGRRARRVTMDRIPILKFGNALLVTIQVDMHDRLATALEDDLTAQDRRAQRARRADRHLGARDRRQLHRPHARQHRRGLAHPRRRHRRGRHAAGGGDHAGRAWPVADRRQDRAERRARHGADPAVASRSRRQTMPTTKTERRRHQARRDDVVRVRQHDANVRASRSG